MSLIKKLWPGHTVDVANGNVASAKGFSSEANCTVTTSSPSSIPAQDLSTGIPISVVSSWEQSNPSVQPVMLQRQSPKMPQGEKLNPGDRVQFTSDQGISLTGTIESLPNDVIA